MGDLGELWDELPMLVLQALTARGTGLANPRGLAQLAEDEDEMPLLVQQLKTEIPKLVIDGLGDLLWKLIQAARTPAGVRKRRSAALTPMARGEAGGARSCHVWEKDCGVDVRFLEPLITAR